MEKKNNRNKLAFGLCTGLVEKLERRAVWRTQGKRKNTGKVNKNHTDKFRLCRCLVEKLETVCE